jgi:hypothetical protein
LGEREREIEREKTAHTITERSMMKVKCHIIGIIFIGGMYRVSTCGMTQVLLLDDDFPVPFDEDQQFDRVYN